MKDEETKKVLTDELAKEILDYLGELWDDYEEEDIQEAINVVNENVGKQLGEIDYDVLTRMIDDEQLGRNISEIKVIKRGNLFG